MLLAPSIPKISTPSVSKTLKKTVRLGFEVYRQACVYFSKEAIIMRIHT